MEQEDKELLLKDLCARLPYKVICEVEFKDSEGWKKQNMSLEGVFINECYFTTDTGSIYSKEFRPYLRPMSSMTDAEKRDFPFPYYFEWIDSNFSLLCSNDEVCASIGFDEMYEIMDWLNAHHFDYRNLIEKGLALEAQEEMYKNY